MARYKRCAMCQRMYEYTHWDKRSYYCSNACKQRAYRLSLKHKKQSSNKPLPPMIGRCEFCGIEFTTRSYRQKYCRVACRQAAYRERKQCQH